jgi:hypothetical protein
MNLFLFFSCTNGKSTDSAVDTSSPTDTSVSSDTGPNYPENPSPFSITISGAQNRDLVFDEPSCSSPTGSNNMRMFWRNKSDAHVFVMVTEVMGGFEGVGSYSPPDFRANIKLQEEAGGQGLYYASVDGSGVTITYDLSEESFLSGTATFGFLQGNDGDISISPSTYPLWCDQVDR